MSESQKPPARRRPTKSTFTTKSGNTIKLNQSLTDRIRARRDAKARRRAVHLSQLPKNRWKRLAYRFKPSTMLHYWFSRDGAIMALKLFGIGIVLCFILLVGVFAYFRKDLPPIKDLSGSKIGGTISYYDRTGQVLLWQDYKDVKRIPVAGNNISPYMKHATIAIEDKNFYKEGAFSVSGILRAALHDVFGSGGGLQGGSTITQQLVKLNENWTNDHTIARKFKEIVLAVDLERQYSKDDILNGYLNIAPYGGEEYGVEAAAEDYFGVSAQNLTLAQAAMLASIPQDPPYYSPYSSPQFNSAISDSMFGQTALLNRQHYVLDQMAKQGYITKDQVEAAKTVDILAQVKPMQSKFNNIKAPYFVEAAKQQLDNVYGSAIVNRGGWQVTTTLNLSLQNLAENLIKANLKNVQSNNGDEEAMVAEDVPTGQIVALVGGVDFSDPDHGQINYAETKIPPGSSFKPYDYVSLINNSTDVGAGSVLYDSQQPLPGYPCTDKTKPLVDNPADPKGLNKCLWDYDFNYPQAESIRYALAGSRNVTAEKAMLSVVPPAKAGSMKVDDYVPSINKTISTADALMDAPNAYQCYHDTALTRTTQCYNSSAIGDGAYLHLDQHVNGLASLSRLGVAIPTTYILKIVDSSQKTIYQWTQPKGTQVVRPDAAYIIDSILSDPDASYLSKPKKFQNYNGWNFAVKTGTTNDNFDGLMTSFSTKYAVVSWVGNHTRTVALKDHHMEDMTEPLTANFMKQATDMLNQKPVNWQEPSDIKKLPAYIQRVHVGDGSVESGNPNNQGTDIYPAWYVQPKGSSSQTIDIVSGGVATSCTPPLARQTQGGSNDNTFSADIFMNVSAGSGGATTNDTVHNCSDSGPTITVTEGSCDDTGKCDFTVAITQGTWPLSGGTYNVAAPAGTISILVNGQTAQTVAIPAGSPNPYNTDIAGVTAPIGSSVQAQVVDSVLYSATSNTLTTIVSP